MNIRQVAKAARVSVATVSRVFNKIQVVEAETRERVLRIAKKLHYHPNILARGLSTKKSQVLGVITSSPMTGGFYGDILHGVVQEAEANDYSVLLMSLRGEEQTAQILKQRWVDGILLPYGGLETPNVKRFVVSGLPLVVINKEVAGVPSAVFDYAGGAREAILSKKNLPLKFAVNVGGQTPSDTTAAGLRLGFNQAVKKLGLPSVHLPANDAGMNAALAHMDPGTLFFIHGPWFFLPFMRLLRKKFGEIPEGLTLICFGEIEGLKFFDGSYTLVKQNIPQIGVEATRLLLSLIRGEKTGKKVVVKTDLAEVP